MAPFLIATGPALRLTATTTKVALDDSFSGGGIVSYSNISSAEDTIVQPNGKIIVVGGSWVMRFNKDGSPDRSFNGGKLRLQLPECSGWTGVSAKAVTLGRDGAIYVAATLSVDNSTAINPTKGPSLTVFKIGSRGQMCSDYKADFAAFNEKADLVKDIALQSDGKVLVLAYKTPSSPMSNKPPAGGYRVVCFDAKGNLDRSFGPGRHVDAADSRAFVQEFSGFRR